MAWINSNFIYFAALLEMYILLKTVLSKSISDLHKLHKNVQSHALSGDLKKISGFEAKMFSTILYKKCYEEIPCTVFPR